MLRPLLPLLPWLSACGSAEPECGFHDCPAGTFSIEYRAYDGEDIDDADADRTYASFDQGECGYSCEAVAPCTDWTVPVITEDCFYCAYDGGDGEPVALGGGIGWTTCGDPDFPSSASEPGGTVVVVGSRGTAFVEPGTSYTGTEQFYWETLDGTELCSATYDIIESTPVSGCADCGWAFELVLANERLDGRSCDSIAMDSKRAEGETVVMGYAASIDLTSGGGATYEDVLWVSFEDGWFPYGTASWFETGSQGTFAYDKVWSAYYADLDD